MNTPFVEAVEDRDQDNGTTTDVQGSDFSNSKMEVATLPIDAAAAAEDDNDDNGETVREIPDPGTELDAVEGPAVGTSDGSDPDEERLNEDELQQQQKQTPSQLVPDTSIVGADKYDTDRIEEHDLETSREQYSTENTLSVPMETNAIVTTENALAPDHDPAPSAHIAEAAVATYPEEPKVTHMSTTIRQEDQPSTTSNTRLPNAPPATTTNPISRDATETRTTTATTTATITIAAAVGTEESTAAEELPSLEECLYGGISRWTDRSSHYSSWNNEVLSPSSSSSSLSPSSEQQQPQLHYDGVSPRRVSSSSSLSHSREVDQWLVDDDWAFVREPESWKDTPHTISMPLLRRIATARGGLPEEGSHRGVTWRVLLGYLPTDNQQWNTTLTEKRTWYCNMVQQYFAHTTDYKNGEELRWKQKRGPWLSSPGSSRGSPTSTVRTTTENTAGSETNDESIPTTTLLSSFTKRHLSMKGLDTRVLDSLLKSVNALRIPIGLIPDTTGGGESYDLHQDSSTHLDYDDAHGDIDDAAYDDFIESARLLDEVRKDVDRTFPDLAFFLDPREDLGKRRYAAIERILFVWSKHNRGVKYVQGMNEIAGTIYYVLAHDWNEEWAREAEADSYWLFHSLLADMRDVFLPDMDTAETGIRGRIVILETLINRHDPEVWEHLKEIGVECSFFAIRWWTTLLSREFLLPDTIRLWDSMFASTHKDNFLCYVGVTMVMLIREELLKGDFSRCLRLLQSYPTVSMDMVLESTRALWLYERQITMACRKGGINLHQALQAVKPPKAIVMAFGLREGVVPLSKEDKLRKAREKAAASVRDATSAMKASAQGFFGRASRFVSHYSDQFKGLKQTVSEDSCQSRESNPGERNESAVSPEDDFDLMYLQAIESADAGKWSYK